jgi:hypothetical protein
MTDEEATLIKTLTALNGRIDALFNMIVSLQHCIEPMLTEYNRKMEGMPVGLRTPPEAEAFNRRHYPEPTIEDQE